MKRMKLGLTGLLGVIAFLTACTKDPLKHLTSDESRIYITSYDSAADFSSYRTYSIADSVGIISNRGAKRDLTAADQAYIDAVNKYMQQRGYVKVDANQNPDLGINVNRIYSTSTGLIDYSDYWDYYGGYWDPSYWGYPGYGYYVPYAYGVYQVTEGMMSIDMFDLKNAQKNNKINLVWNGLVRGEGVFNAENADPSVAQLFSESQYLHAGQ
jgi:Domain of unknown function (DUF4136)